MSRRTAVAEASPRACSQCPWRLSNQGKRHPGGWYTKANLRRLWGRLRQGDPMTCHPTDPENPLPPGFNPPAEGVKTTECAGALTLQQREVTHFQDICKEDPRGNALRTYKQRHPGGMTRNGLMAVVERELFGGVPLLGCGSKMTRPNLNDREIGYEPLRWHFPDPEAKEAE